jgi:hypothetical protein
MCSKRLLTDNEDAADEDGDKDEDEAKDTGSSQVLALRGNPKALAMQDLPEPGGPLRSTMCVSCSCASRSCCITLGPSM